MKLYRGVMAAVLIAAGCRDTTGPLLQLDSEVRVVHAATQTPPLNVVIEGEPRTRLDYADASAYHTIAAGERTIQFFTDGQNTPPLIVLNAIIEPARPYTALAVGTAGNLATILVVDDPTRAEPGQGRIRFIHAAPTAGTADIYVTQPGADLATANPTITNVDFGDASDNMVFDASTWQVRVTAAGTQNILIDQPLLPIPSTGTLTIVIMDAEGSGPPHGLIVLND